MDTPRDTEELIARISGAVLAAHDLDEALEAITLNLRDEHSLWATGIWRFEDLDDVRLLATWSVADTLFEPNLVVRLTLTEDVGSIAGTLLRGRPVRFRVAERDLGMLSDMLRREGISSVALVPLKDGTVPAGVLALGSTRAEGFRQADLRLFTAIARAISPKLAGMLGEPADRA